ncbi:MAG: ASKHA domain-containing protein [Acidobacteriaceae bacterium]
MTEHTVRFDIAKQPVRVPTGTLLSEAARLAGLDIGQPCGGQGRCGRCAVLVTKGKIRRRSTLRLSAEDVSQGYALACQSVIEADVHVTVPPQEKIERRLTTDRTAIEVSVPPDYDPQYCQALRRVSLRLTPPRMDDQTDDWSRLRTALRQKAGFEDLRISLNQLQQQGTILRENNWQVTVITDAHIEIDGRRTDERLVALIADIVPEDDPLYGLAIDIGTTTVTVWLVDLITGKVDAQASEYNGQINRGEDVISRIIYSSKNSGREELQNRVLDTINQLVAQACKRAKARPQDIFKATVAGNSTMMHLFLGIPAASIRLSPFITAVNQPPFITAGTINLAINPEASVDCLPGVASYVGADISSGVLACRMDEAEKLSLFLDVGTNGETVLGSREWLVTCACSAGPAFEGAGVLHGMRATKGAIEECWISGENAPHPFEPSYRVIGNGKARGICGSGLISLLAEMFLTGVVDKGGAINLSLGKVNARIREGEHGPEYVVAWGAEAENGKDIAVNNVDIDNLKRAKAAIYAGFTVLAQSVGVPLEMVEQILIGGSFGKYINVEKAIQIGLLPDMPWDRFKFLGNTSVQGAYLSLLDWRNRDRVRDIASQMTYIELSADNTFYDAFMSAMFLPHTNLASFPSVAALLENKTVP